MSGCGSTTQRRAGRPDGPARPGIAGSLLGWWEAARAFVMARLPLFVALALAFVVLLVLVVRRRLAERRARRARQRELYSHVSSTDGMSGPDF